MLYRIQLKRVCIQMSWIPHCVTRFSWDNFAIGITVRLSCYLARKLILCRCSQWISPKSLSDQWPVLLLSELCTSARLGFFFLPVNTDAEQVDVFMKWMWHLSWELRLNHSIFGTPMSNFAVVAVCISQLACDWLMVSTGNWNWGGLLTSEVVSQHTQDVIWPPLEV